VRDKHDLISCNNIINDYTARSVNPGVYQNLQQKILTNGFYDTCLGAYFLELPGKKRYLALGGNNRVWIARCLLIPVKGVILRWKDIAAVSVEADLAENVASFKLTTKILKVLAWAISKTETGNHERSLLDEVRDFKMKVDLNKEKFKFVDGFLRFDINHFYKVVFGVTITGRNWKEVDGAVERRKEKNDVLKNLGQKPIGSAIKKASNFYKCTGAVDAKYHILEKSLMATAHNENIKLSAAYYMLKGLRFFYDYPKAYEKLRLFRVDSRRTEQIVNGIGNLTYANHAVLAQMIEEEKYPGTSKLFDNIRSDVPKEANRRLKKAKEAAGRPEVEVEEEVIPEGMEEIVAAVGKSKKVRDQVIAACNVVFAAHEKEMEALKETIDSLRTTLRNEGIKGFLDEDSEEDPMEIETGGTNEVGGNRMEIEGEASTGSKTSGEKSRGRTSSPEGNTGEFEDVEVSEGSSKSGNSSDTSTAPPPQSDNA